MSLSWWGLCLDNSPLSKFFSLPVLPPPLCWAPLSCQAHFINGSSWRAFSGIQGLLPSGVLISPDAWNTGRRFWTQSPFRLEWWTLWGPRWLGPGSTPRYAVDGRSPKQGVSPWARRINQQVFNRGMNFCAVNRYCFLLSLNPLDSSYLK